MRQQPFRVIIHFKHAYGFVIEVAQQVG